MSEKKFARNRFAIGDRVRLSALGIMRLGGMGSKVCPFNDDLRGTVVGFGRKSVLLLRVHRDGLKESDTYHHEFWEHA